MSEVVIQRTSRILVDIAALGTTSLDSIYMRGADPSGIILRTIPTTTRPPPSQHQCTVEVSVLRIPFFTGGGSALQHEMEVGVCHVCPSLEGDC